MTSIKQIAWVAGILEGEGSFGFSNNSKCPCIWLGMSDIDVIRGVRNIIDPSYAINIHGIKDNRLPHYKKQYRITVNGIRAIQWMMTIYPLMSRRRKDRIKQLLSTWMSWTYSDRYRRDKRTNLIRRYVKSGLTREEAIRKVDETLQGAV
jgi:hypothetical protein